MMFDNTREKKSNLYESCQQVEEIYTEIKKNNFFLVEARRGINYNS